MGGGGVKDSGGIETRGGNEGSYRPDCKRTTWHTPDNCFELNKNRAKQPSYWKYVLGRQGTNGNYICKVNSTRNTYSYTIHNPIVSPSYLLSGKRSHKISRKRQHNLLNRAATKIQKKKREIFDDKDASLVNYGASEWYFTPDAPVSKVDAQAPTIRVGTATGQPQVYTASCELPIEGLARHPEIGCRANGP